MTQRQKENSRSAVLIRMLITTQILLATLDHGTEQPLVMLAIRLGWYERKPMDVSSLAASTGLPRTTVIRHLKALEARNWIAFTTLGRRRVPIFTGIDAKRVANFMRRLEDTVHNTSALLSKMDT